MKIHEIDRRGFLRGLGAAGAAAMVPGLAKAAGQVDFKSIAIAIKDIFVQHLKLSGNAQPTAAGKFKFTFDKQGKLVGKEQLESCGDRTLDAAVLQSATNIPSALVAKWQSESPRVSIAFGVGDGWWKAAVPASTPRQSTRPESSVNDLSNDSQKFVDLIIASNPKAVISKIVASDYPQGVRIIYALGDFGNDNLIAFVSPTGIELRLLGNLGPMSSLKTPWQIGFGGQTTKQIFLGNNNTYQDKAPSESKNFYVDDRNKITSMVPTAGKSVDDGMLVIKGLQMGMSPAEVKAIAGDGDSVFGYTLAGQKFDWSKFTYTNGGLSGILLGIDTSKNYNRSFDWSAVLDAVAGKYGQGNKTNEKFKTRGGGEYDNLKTIWILPDGSNILMVQHADRLGSGFISFTSPKGNKENSTKRRDQESKNKSDI